MKKNYQVVEKIIYRDKKGRFVKAPEKYEDDEPDQYKAEMENAS